MSLRKIFLALVVVTAPAAWGRWVGAGGGEIAQDAHNPWFLKNVTNVPYCVDVAAASVSVSPDTVRTTVKEALTYWKNELGKVAQGSDKGQFTLGDQTFNEVSCSDTLMLLHIQVGYDTLTPEQISFIDEPLKYIGMAVRTDYDSDLHGKGFIFIASDLGANSYHGGADTTLVSQAWSHPQLLKYALLHELGHVFGLPHTGSGLMSESFLEQMLSTNLADAFEVTPIESFFSPDNELDFCGADLSPSARTYFGVPPGMDCLHLSHSSGSLKWLVSARERKPESPGGVSRNAIW